MAALQFAAPQDACFWLHDIRLRNTSHVNQRNWFTNTFVPAANSALKGSKFIAYLMSPLQREALVQKSVSALAPVRHSDLMTVRYFTSEHDALKWLEECRFQVLA